MCIAAVYVDDIILTSPSIDLIHTLKAHLHAVFSIKDLGPLSFFLGIEVSRISQGIILSQRKFTKELADCEFDVSKSTKTPLPLNIKLLVDDDSPYSDPFLYRCLVGKLNFLTHTRPAISFTVQTLSQFLHAPKVSHVQALQHLLRYIAGTVRQGILLQATK